MWIVLERRVFFLIAGVQRVGCQGLKKDLGDCVR